MPEDLDVADWLTRLPQPAPAELCALLAAARRESEAAPRPEPSIIPMPDLPPLWPHLGFDVVRYPCALGCGWAHPENLYPADEPFSIRVDDLSQISAALTRRAEARAAEARERIESAIRRHFADVHPGCEIPLQGVA